MRTRSACPAVAEDQDGVFTAAQALSAGWSTWEVRRRRHHGDWVTVAGRGLTVRGGARQTAEPAEVAYPPRMLARAAQLTWPDAVACRRVAAGLHGFPVASGNEVDVLTARGRRPAAGLRPHHRPAALERVTVVGGLPVTDREQTALDCLAHLPFDEALDLFAWLSTRQILTPRHLQVHAAGQLRRPGAVQLRRLVAVTRDGAVSAAEYRFHQVLKEAGLLGWTAGASVTGADGRACVVDVLFVAERLVIEIDGERGHRGRDAFVRDRRRQNALIGAGYTVLRFTWWDLHRRPDEVVAEVRRELARIRAGA